MKFTKEELDLILLLAYDEKCCESGCIYPEMQSSQMDCDECVFPKRIKNLISKIENS